MSVVSLDMVMGLFGGLALFLYGMDRMAAALKVVAGNRMRSLLGSLTRNRVTGLATGAGVTAVLQSSSVTTVMLVGFVSAGLMSLSQAIGVVLGANIGTTITAQIIAFKVTKFALIPVAVGFLVYFLSTRERTKQLGYLIMGLGLIFFGMSLMSASMKPLRGHQPFIDWMQGMTTPVTALAVAAAFTALVQSSSATMGVVIAMSMQGLVTLDIGIALLLGANVGTCVTAGLAAIGKPREAVRVAVAHVTFNLVGAVAVIWFIPPFADLVRSFSPASAADLSGLDRLAAEAPRQIAHAHTLFNVGVAVLFLPFATVLARFCERVVPDRPLVELEPATPKYLQEELLQTPSVALAAARSEIVRLGDVVDDMLRRITPAMLSGAPEDLESIAKLDDVVDALHGHIVKYLGNISRRPLGDDQSREVLALLEIATALEHIGDIIETELVGRGQRRLEQELDISDATKHLIEKTATVVRSAVADAIRCLRDHDNELARTVVGQKADIQELFEEVSRHQASRLLATEPHRRATYALEADIFERLRRIYYFAKRVAKCVLSEEAN
jgi:phosphate:Na+ symporter